MDVVESFKYKAVAGENDVVKLKHGLDVFSDCWLAYIMKYRSRLNVVAALYIAGFKGARTHRPPTSLQNSICQRIDKFKATHSTTHAAAVIYVFWVIKLY